MRYFRPTIILIAIIISLCFVASAEGIVSLKNSNLTGYRASEEGILSEDGSYLRNIAGQFIHTNFQKNTNSCASCHTTHVAANAELLFHPTGYGLCVTCHNGSESGLYDVMNGSVAAGRFFEDSLIDAGSRSGVSYHNSTGLLTHGDAPGADTSLPGDWESVFTCNSCHNPHGSFSDRLLRYSVNGKSDHIVAMVFENQYEANENVTHLSGVVGFCTACHSSYADGHPFAVDTYNSFSHEMNINVVGNEKINSWAVNNINLEIRTDFDKRLTCLSCHFAHGTDVAMIKQRGFDFELNGGLESLPIGTEINENTRHLRFWGADSGCREACLICHATIPENTPPRVLSTIPADGADDVNSSNNLIEIEFDLELDNSDPPQVTVDAEGIFLGGIVSVDGFFLRFSLYETFMEGKAHTVTVIKVKANNGAVLSEFIFEFRVTADMIEDSGGTEDFDGMDDLDVIEDQNDTEDPEQMDVDGSSDLFNVISRLFSGWYYAV
jgi:predicted CXXCH cytochrome family protein